MIIIVIFATLLSCQSHSNPSPKEDEEQIYDRINLEAGIDTDAIYQEKQGKNENQTNINDKKQNDQEKNLKNTNDSISIVEDKSVREPFAKIETEKIWNEKILPYLRKNKLKGKKVFFEVFFPSELNGSFCHYSHFAVYHPLKRQITIYSIKSKYKTVYASLCNNGGKVTDNDKNEGAKINDRLKTQYIDFKQNLKKDGYIEITYEKDS